jgi:hypothetical protein
MPGLTLAMALLCTIAAHAGEIRNYGMYLEDKYFLRTAENAGEVTILLREEMRAKGGPSLWVEPESDDEPIIRYKDERALARITSQVLLPAPPNYLKNPGVKYRVTIEGIEIGPEFATMFHVNAGDARNAVQTEMAKLIQLAHGIERDALYYGTVLALRALNEAQRMPAEIPLTVLRSDVGQFRISGPGLTRREVGRTQRFSDVKEGQEFNRVMEVDDRLTDPEIEPGYRRRPSTELGRGQTHFQRESNPYKKIEPPNYRVEQVKSLKSEESPYAKPGIAGRPLTVPEVELPPMTAAQNLNRDILRGGTLSAADAIAGRASGQAPEN